MEPLRLDKGNVYKGNLHFVAEFVPAIALRNVHFSSGSNELDKVLNDSGESDTASISTKESGETVPEGVTIRRPMGDSTDEEVLVSKPKRGHTKGAKSTDTTKTTGSVRTANTSGTAETAETAETSPRMGVELPKEQLLKYRMSSLSVTHLIRN